MSPDLKADKGISAFTLALLYGECLAALVEAWENLRDQKTSLFGLLSALSCLGDCALLWQPMALYKRITQVLLPNCSPANLEEAHGAHGKNPSLNLPSLHESTVYNYISGERVWSPQCFCWLECAQCVCSWTRTLLGGFWNVRNFCDTCTTAGKRAQHLWHVHNISETCTYRILENTGWGRWNTLYNIYIFIIIIIKLLLLPVVPAWGGTEVALGPRVIL